MKRKSLILIKCNSCCFIVLWCWSVQYWNFSLDHKGQCMLMRQHKKGHQALHLYVIANFVASWLKWLQMILNDYKSLLLPYPCSRFYADVKFDIRFDNRFDIKLGESFHVNHTINFGTKFRFYGIVSLLIFVGKL